MKKLLLLILLLKISISYSQIHNRLIKFNVGYSTEQYTVKNQINILNVSDSINKFSYNFGLPVITISEEFTLNELFSFTGTLGYQYFDIDYNNDKYGTNLFFVSVNPQLSIFYKAGFEYYLKLKLGYIYRFGIQKSIPEQSQRLLPEKSNLFTGVTFGGFNFFFHDHWGANLELSLWSPELINFGLTYRFFKGERPKNIPNNGYYID
jgi:hypothetical protein